MAQDRSSDAKLVSVVPSSTPNASGAGSTAESAASGAGASTAGAPSGGSGERPAKGSVGPTGKAASGAGSAQGGAAAPSGSAPSGAASSPRGPMRAKGGGGNAGGAASTKRNSASEVARLYMFLDNRPWFRPFMVVLCAMAAGLVVAPRLESRSYPSQPGLIGTPAAENIKATRDFDVVDEETTTRLIDEAVGHVRRVYDFDLGRSSTIAERIQQAFATASERYAAAVKALEQANVGRRRLSARQRAKQREQLRAAIVEAGEGLRETSGLDVAVLDLELLGGVKFDPALGAALARVLLASQNQPVVADTATFDDGDRENGLHLQRVPKDDTPRQQLDDVTTVVDLSTAKRQVAKYTETFASERSTAERAWITRVVSDLLSANLTLNQAETETARAAARDAVKPVVIAVKKGEMIIRDGERFNRRHLLILSALNKTSQRSSVLLAAWGAAFIMLIVLLTGMSITRRHPRPEGSSRDILFLTFLFLAYLVLAKVGLVVVQILHDRFSNIPMEVFLAALPVASGAIVVRLVLRTELALLFAVISSVALGLLVEGTPMFGLYALVGSALGATMMGNIRARSDLMRVGLWVGLGQAAVAVATLFFAAETTVAPYVMIAPVAFVTGSVASLVALAATTVVEAFFRYTTDLKLLELANLNHPALKELIVQAPGSYHHSIIVGSLVEAAAEAIGANPLLVRVMAYYHDLGKGCNPGYFIENQRAGQNPHDKLKPSMSAMIIRRHVTDGLDIARRYRLGDVIMAGIAEHHGTTLIHYFYHKALENADEDNPVSESDYRYPGRKPQSQEAALVMLGDSVEAAARSLPDPTPARLQGLVNRIINMKFADGQLDECDITLRDLHTIARAFTRILNSIYHQRVEYPSVLQDLMGKKQNGDPDSKPSKKGSPAPDRDPATETRGPDDLKRLGLS